ncbi:putative enzyme [uncultured Mycobacterium sp.]|uniref:Putative enzyme n=1 Tax=uncultured Mycobacterium sp. TaxID=171292 RepID=A0A1Y5PIH5_9MYCO|nr:putative enzyme [uncultured Mycobacterium sp.]SBS75708.1 putative enzyme [uncultured Mycobacterium sp.]
MAVPPDLVGFVESAGITAVAYQLDSQTLIESYVNYWASYYGGLWKKRDLIKFSREGQVIGTRALAETSETLMSLADGVDLLLTGVNFEHPAANVAEYHDIPLATMHFSPIRVNSQVVPILPPTLGRYAMAVREWVLWRIGSKKLEDAQRRELGLPSATGPLPHRMAERGSLEIQAYDDVCFPGLAEEWATWGRRRPFVGTLTIEMPTQADEDVLSWIAAGTPPICFGFGSMLVESGADTLTMIADACARLGERALISAGVTQLDDIPNFEHVKVVRGVNYAAVFPACRAVVHHGTSATAAGLRAGVPTLVLWKIPEQRLWGNAIKRLKVGTERCFSSTTRESLTEDLRTVLDPQCVARSREIATRMSKPAESASYTADLVEELARSRRM